LPLSKSPGQQYKKTTVDNRSMPLQAKLTAITARFRDLDLMPLQWRRALNQRKCRMCRIAQSDRPTRFSCRHEKRMSSRREPGEDTKGRRKGRSSETCVHCKLTSTLGDSGSRDHSIEPRLGGIPHHAAGNDCQKPWRPAPLQQQKLAPSGRSRQDGFGRRTCSKGQRYS